jgi:hypothetical protein
MPDGDFDKINTILASVGLVGSVFGFIFTAWYTRSVRQKDSEEQETKRQISALWTKYDGHTLDIDNVRDQMNVLQGEHNVLSCKRGKK